MPLVPATHVPLYGGIRLDGRRNDYTVISVRRRIIAPHRVGDLRLVFCNWYNNAGVETGVGNNVVIKAAIEARGAANPIAVTWSGSATATVASGGLAVSDPINVTIQQGEGLYVRLGASVDAGQYIPTAQHNGASSVGGQDSWNLGNDVVTGVGPMTTSGGSIQLPACTEVWGLPAIAPARSFLMIGDSTANSSGRRNTLLIGDGDYPAGDDGSWADRLFRHGGFHFANHSGESMLQWNSGHSGRGQLVPSYTDIIVTYGRNDLTSGVTLATLQSRFNTLVSDLRALNSSARIWSCTILPKTTSTDAWQTEANQTVEAGTEAARVAFNEWLRAGVSGVYTNLDVASAVETTSNGGKWRVDEVAWQGACSAAASTTIDIAASEWSTNQWVQGATVVITSGAGAGQRRVIASNTATKLTVSAWDTVPSPGDTMQIMPLYTIDGIHAAQYGYVAIARAMDVAHRHGRLSPDWKTVNDASANISGTLLTVTGTLDVAADNVSGII